MRRIAASFVSAIFGLCLISPPAAALTARDVLEKMEDREYGAYMIASVSMAAFIAHTQGDDERAACITNWWFDTPETKSKVVAVFARFPDRTPQAILYVLINKQCGQPKTAPR